jgi:hypothetical protein
MAINESAVYFYPGGGHNHDGENSSLLDTSKYSVFDFNYAVFGNPDRVAGQILNRYGWEQFIVATVNKSILEPAGLILQPGIINGASHIISESITANQIAANTITATQIAANTITANNLTANFVLVDQVITSSDWDGTYDANGLITNSGTSGWAISYSGEATFSNTIIRGTLVAGEVYINAFNYWLANGVFNVGFDSNNVLSFDGANLFITGQIFATGGEIAGLQIYSDRIESGGTYSGTLLLGKGAGSYGTLQIEGAAIGSDIPWSNIIGGAVEVSLMSGNSVIEYSIMDSFGLEYGAYSNTDIFAFSWDAGNSQLYAHIYHTGNSNITDYCIANCGTATVGTVVVGTVGTVVVGTVVVSEPPTVVVGEPPTVVVGAPPTVVVGEPCSCVPPCPEGFICVDCFICMG